MPKVTGKTVRDKFYKQSDDDPKVWICNCGIRRKKKVPGYTNLVEHVAKQHPAEYLTLQNDISSGTNVVSSPASLFFYSKKHIVCLFG